MVLNGLFRFRFCAMALLTLFKESAGHVDWQPAESISELIQWWIYTFFFLQICQVSTECMVPHVFFPHQPDHPDPNYGRGKSWGWIAAAPRWIHQWWPGAVYTGLMAISIKEGWTWGFSTLGFMEWVPDFQFLEIWYSINPVLEIPWNKWSQCISRKSAWTSRRALTCTATMSLRPLKETWVAVLFGESMLGW